MKLLILLKTEKLPRHYHFLLSSVIKSALEKSNPQLQKDLYAFSEQQANKQMKPFTGSIYLNEYTLEKEEFLIQKDVRLTISSPDAEFILYLYNGFVQKSQYVYQQYELMVEQIKILPEKLPKTNRVLFKTASPIVIKNRQGHFLNLDDADYQSELNYAANECVKALENRPLYAPITLSPVVMHKRVVQLKHESFAKLNDKNLLYMNAYEGSFILEGHSEDLAFLAQSGLGFRRALCFGAIEMINE